MSSSPNGVDMGGFCARALLPESSQPGWVEGGPAFPSVLRPAFAHPGQFRWAQSFPQHLPSLESRVQEGVRASSPLGRI